MILAFADRWWTYREVAAGDGIFAWAGDSKFSSGLCSMILRYEFVTKRALALSKSMFAFLAHTLVDFKMGLVF
jgi:hypothetical protein